MEILVLASMPAGRIAPLRPSHRYGGEVLAAAGWAREPPAGRSPEAPAWCSARRAGPGRPARTRSVWSAPTRDGW